MRSLCLLLLVVGGFLWDDCVQARVIQATDEVTSLGHLYLLDSNTGHSQRLKRRHVEAPQDHVHRIRLDLVSCNKVIDMDLKSGSVWDSTSNVWVRNGEDTQQVLHDLPENCFLSGRLRSGDGYASFSFCNGVSGIIHTDKRNYIIGDIDNDRPQDVTSNDTDADIPSLPVKITSGDDVTAEPTEDTPEADVEALELEDGLDPDEDDVVPTEDSDEDEIADSTPAGSDSSTTTTTSRITATTRKTTLITGQRKAVVEVGIYINADYTNIMNRAGLTTVSQIMDWVIRRWNLIRQVYGNTDSVGMEVDFKIRHLEIWFKNPAYFVPVERNKTIGDHLGTFCKRSPNDGMDHRMMYTWETKRIKVGLAYIGTICRPKSKCSIVIPSKNSIQREVHELGHNFGLPHEPKISNCQWPYGFMGWSNNAVFKDCYRPLFLAAMAKPSYKCLYSFSGVKTQIASYRAAQFVQANQSFVDILDKW